MTYQDKTFTKIELWAVHRLRGCRDKKAKRLSGLSNPNQYAQSLLTAARVLRAERRYMSQEGLDYDALVDMYRDRIREINEQLKALRAQRQELNLLVRASNLIVQAAKFRPENMSKDAPMAHTNLDRSSSGQDPH